MPAYLVGQSIQDAAAGLRTVTALRLPANHWALAVEVRGDTTSTISRDVAAPHNLSVEVPAL